MIMEIITTLGLLIGIVPVIAEYANKILLALFQYELQGTTAKIVSWIIGVGITSLYAWNDPGAFDAFPSGAWWILGAVWGPAVSACANGLFQLDAVRQLLVIIRARGAK